MPKVRVFHNVALDEQGRHLGFFGYRPGQPLTWVAEVSLDEPTEPQAVCDVMFEQLNIDFPTAPWAQEYRERRNRSLSVGDAVEVDGVAYACVAFGWDPIEAPLLIEQVTLRGTTPWAPQ